MAGKPYDKTFRMVGIVGLILLLGLVAWRNQGSGKTEVTSPKTSSSEDHDHADPAQHGNRTQGAALDEEAAAATLSGQTEGDLRLVPFEAFRFGFSPDPLVVLAGERVKLRIKSRDVKHGVMIPEIDFSAAVPVGKTIEAEFTAPAAAGKYPIFCSVFCGTGHGTMKGTLVVLPPAKEDGHEQGHE